MVTFTGTRPTAPAAVPTEQVRLASFDVGNWFTTTGPPYVAGGRDRTCSYVRDRLGVATMNTCTPAGPRGAADQTSRLRQRQKLAAAINGLGASIVGLQGIENSAKFGGSRDAALADLVTGLNAAAGSPDWDYVSSPVVPAGTDAQVVRTGFIYKPAIVRPVGSSVITSDPSGAFDTAVEPLAQRFARAFELDGEAVTVIVNQFTSRQAGTDDGTGQGLGNAQRESQAAALADFAAEQGAIANRVFLLGNFNTYGNEGPFDELARVRPGDEYRQADVRGRRLVRLAGPRARQRRGAGHRGRRWRVGHQLLGVTGLPLREVERLRDQPGRSGVAVRLV